MSRESPAGPTSATVVALVPPSWNNREWVRGKQYEMAFYQNVTLDCIPGIHGERDRTSVWRAGVRVGVCELTLPDAIVYPGAQTYAEVRTTTGPPVEVGDVLEPM